MFYATRLAIRVLLISGLVSVVLGCWLAERKTPLSGLQNFITQKKNTEGERCYNGWGCFPEFEKSKELTKPLSDLLMFSDPPEDIDVHFYMFDCQQKPTKGQVVRYNASDEVLSGAPYDGQKETVLIIHGFTDKFDEMEWMGYMKDFILDHHCDDYNVIGVDWRNASQTCNYFNSVADTQIVGTVTAVFIRNLMRVYNQRPEQFIVVGHSLGAHVSGFVGANFTEPKLKAIYGLDPAGPAYSDIDTKFRLDPSDAKMVVTLTTNAGLTVVNGNGIKIPVGDYSFFVNGGYHQPGCDGRPGEDVSITDALFTSSASCSHQRPTWLVQVARNETDECHSIGYQCESYEAYENGECGSCADGSDQCKPLYSFFDHWAMNETKTRPENKTKVYFVDTSDSWPYCLCQYQLIIRTGEGDSFKGNFKVALEGELRDRDAFDFKKDNFDIEPNESYRALVKMPKNVGKLKSIQIEAILGPSLLPQSSKTIAIRSVELNYMSAPNEQKRKLSSSSASFSGDSSKIETAKPKRFTIQN